MASKFNHHAPKIAQPAICIPPPPPEGGPSPLFGPLYAQYFFAPEAWTLVDPFTWALILDIQTSPPDILWTGFLEVAPGQARSDVHLDQPTPEWELNASYPFFGSPFPFAAQTVPTAPGPTWPFDLIFPIDLQPLAALDSAQLLALYYV